MNVVRTTNYINWIKKKRLFFQAGDKTESIYPYIKGSRQKFKRIINGQAENLKTSKTNSLICSQKHNFFPWKSNLFTKSKKLPKMQNYSKKSIVLFLWCAFVLNEVKKVTNQGTKKQGVSRSRIRMWTVENISCMMTMIMTTVWVMTLPYFTVVLVLIGCEKPA